MDPSYLGVGNGYWGDGDVGIMFSKCLTTAFTNHIGFDANGKTSFGKKSADGKTFYWYNKNFRCNKRFWQFVLFSCTWIKEVTHVLH